MESKPDVEAFGSPSPPSPLPSEGEGSAGVRGLLGACFSTLAPAEPADSSAGTFRRHAMDRAAVVYDVELALLVFTE